MFDETFLKLLHRLEAIWYYIIRVDDWDRYLREVYAQDEVVFIATSPEEAYMKLWEFVQNDLAE